MVPSSDAKLKKTVRNRIKSMAVSGLLMAKLVEKI